MNQRINQEVFMKRNLFSALIIAIFLMTATSGFAFSLFSNGTETLTPKNGELLIPIKNIDDGTAHYFEAVAQDGTKVRFFTLKSKDGIIRAAFDTCDVCYRSGKGYKQDGDYMVCQNCGQRFASNKINEVKGGCNPSPLNRIIENGNLIVSMKDINDNSWYFQNRR